MRRQWHEWQIHNNFFDVEVKIQAVLGYESIHEMMQDLNHEHHENRLAFRRVANGYIANQ